MNTNQLLAIYWDKCHLIREHKFGMREKSHVEAYQHYAMLQGLQPVSHQSTKQPTLREQRE